MSYCDFKPGDEVVCVDASGSSELVLRARYTVIEAYGDGFTLETQRWEPGVRVFEAKPGDGCYGFRASRFRKVQRRDIGKWLEQSTDFEEPKRAPAKEPA